LKVKAIIQWIYGYSEFLFQIPGPLILIGKILIKGEVIYWGTAYMQFLPWRVAAWEMLRNGIFPLWNAQSGMGAPLMANYQSAFFYPPNLFLWLGGFLNGISGIAYAQTVLVMIHLILGGIGMVLLTKSLGLSKTAQTISGISFGLTSYAVARASFLSMNAAIAWIPFQLWSSLNFLRGSISDKNWQRRKYLIFHTIFLTFQLLSGHAQITWYTQILILFWALLWIIGEKRRKVFRNAYSLSLSMLIALLISAVQLIPTAEYLLQSQRADAVSYDYAVNYSFWGWRILSLFSPNLFGNPGNGNYWVTADNYWEDAIYFGFIPLILAMIFFIRTMLGHKSNIPDAKKVTLFWGIISLVGFIFALGKNTVIFPFLYRYIPSFDLFQAPTRFNVWLVVGGAILAGYGFDQWIKPVDRWLYWSRLGAMAGAGAVLTSAAANVYLVEMIQKSYLQGAVETSILFLFAALLNLAFTEKGKRKSIWQFAVILVILSDLLYAGWFSNPGIKINQENLERQSVWYPGGDTRVWLPQTDESILKFDKYFRFDTFALPVSGEHLLDVYLPNTNLLFKKFAVNNYDPFVPARFSKFQSEILEYIQVNKSAPLAFLNIGMVHRVNPAVEKIYHFPIDNAERYHYFTCADYSSTEDETLKKTKELFLSGALLEKVILEGTVGNQTNQCEIRNATIDYQVLENNPNYQKIALNTNVHGWFVQMDSWYPGWEVKINGQSGELLRANYLFRGVEIPPGNHVIEFFYAPVSFVTGLIISIISMIGCICWITLTYLRRKHYE